MYACVYIYIYICRETSHLFEPPVQDALYDCQSMAPMSRVFYGSTVIVVATSPRVDECIDSELCKTKINECREIVLSSIHRIYVSARNEHLCLSIYLTAYLPSDVSMCLSVGPSVCLTVRLAI